MNFMKYIILDNGMNQYSIIFPSHIEHSSMSGRFNDSVVSAGFVKTAYDGTLVCYGSSMTLNVKSREQDSTIINHALGLKKTC